MQKWYIFHSDLSTTTYGDKKTRKEKLRGYSTWLSLDVYVGDPHFKNGKRLKEVHDGQEIISKIGK